MISEETSLNNTFSEFTLKYFSLIIIIQIRTNKARCVPMKGVREMRRKTSGSSTRITELHASDQYADEKEQSLLVWLNSEMEGGQSILSNLFSGYSSHSSCQNSKIQLFKRGLRSEKGTNPSQIAIKGILNSKICCRIISDANMARNPDKNDLHFLLDLLRVQYMNLD